MTFDCDSALSTSDFSLPKSSAYVILYNTETCSVKLREAKTLGRIKIEKYAKDEILICDPKRENGQEIYRIVYFGDRDTGKSLINSLKNDEDVFFHDEQEPSTSENSTRSTRNTPITPNDPNHNSDIYKLLAVMRSEQKEVKNLLDKLDNENKNLKTKLDEIIEKSSCENRKTRAPSSSEVSELLQHCTSEVAKRRLNQNFEEKLSKIPWEIIKVGKRDKKNIMDELRWERRITKMISNIGTILFGTDLLTHLLGRNGKRERSRRESERPHVFNVQQESRLRRVLSVFDDTFTSDKTWKHVVQYHINQKGRDVKKAKKRLSDEYTSDSATDSEPIVKKAKKTDITEISSSDSDSSNQKDRGKRNPPRKSKLKETEIIERNDEENAKEKCKEKDKPDEIGNRKKHDNMETGIGSSKSDDVTSQLVCEKPANNNNDKELTEISDKTKDNFPYSQAIPLTQNL